MTDLDLLTGALAAQLRLLPDVVRLYPTRTGLHGLTRTVTGLLDAVADDPAVAIRPVDGGYLIEASIGIADATPAGTVATAVSRVVRDACAASGVVVRQVRIRVASVD